MPKIISQINPGSTDYKHNYSAMQTLVEQLEKIVATIALGGDEKARARHLTHGKLLPRARL